MGLIIFNTLSYIVSDVYLGVSYALVSIFTEQSVWVVLFIGVVLGLSLGILFARLNLTKDKRKKTKLLDRTVNRFIHERNKAEAILSDIDVGILAYGSDGSMINYNPAFCKIMEVKVPPSTFKKFLMQFGSDNGLQAGIMLGTGISEGLYDIGKRKVRIKLKLATQDFKDRAATIVLAQDVTQQDDEEKRRKEFVANVSHELRTPLTTIKTYSESLLDWGLKEKNKESIRKDLSRIHEDSMRMSTLIDNLLLLSRIDNKKIVSGMDQHDMTSIVKSVVDRLQIQAEEKKIKLECYTLAKLPWVFVDRADIDRVMVNIISNAIKYTDENGNVTVYLGVLVDDVYVKVSDTGFGIEDSKIPFIFDRFFRVDMTGSRMYGGTGLGLSIAKELVDLHKGDITVHSTLGKGTDFIVRLPFAKKVFEDAVGYTPDGKNDAEEHIYAVAQDLLKTRAKELQISVDSFSSLPPEKIIELINGAVYEDIGDSLE